MTTTELYRYQNGNCNVSLLSDGTKERTYSGTPQPVFPESIDLKITNYCDAGCGFCHEQSTVHGKHADVETVKWAIKGLPRGVEIAIGGGNPLSHPHLSEILYAIKDAGLVANLTIRDQHVWDALSHGDIYDGKPHDLRKLQRDGLVHGIGISGITSTYRLRGETEYRMDENGNFADVEHPPPLSNVVLHCIVGVTEPMPLALARLEFPILVLGYKQFGFGVQYFSDEVQSLMHKWRYWIASIIRNNTVSFDNLALKQLDVRQYLTDEEWDLQYMGDDGRFTMYVDAVTSQYAISSTSQRYRFLRGKTTIENMFAHVRSLTESTP